MCAYPDFDRNVDLKQNVVCVPGDVHQPCDRERSTSAAPEEGVF